MGKVPLVGHRNNKKRPTLGLFLHSATLADLYKLFGFCPANRAGIRGFAKLVLPAVWAQIDVHFQVFNGYPFYIHNFINYILSCCSVLERSNCFIQGFVDFDGFCSSSLSQYFTDVTGWPDQLNMFRILAFIACQQFINDYQCAYAGAGKRIHFSYVNHQVTRTVGIGILACLFEFCRISEITPVLNSYTVTGRRPSICKTTARLIFLILWE